MIQNNKFNLFLIRHGQTAINAEGKVIGQPTDIPLTEYGEWQASNLRTRFKPFELDKIFSSTYTRAKQTAEIAFPNREIILSEELREYTPGDWTGKDRKEIVIPEIIYKMKVMGNAFLPPNGESLSQVGRRTSKWLEDNILYNQEIIKLSEQKEVNIAVVSHGLSIKTIFHYIMGFNEHFTWKIEILNASVSKFSFGEDGWKLHYINDTSHIDRGK
jgi:broad specificity phosphatase PhoE